MRGLETRSPPVSPVDTWVFHYIQIYRTASEWKDVDFMAATLAARDGHSDDGETRDREGFKAYHPPESPTHVTRFERD